MTLKSDITLIVEPLDEFWDTFHDDEYFKWVIDFTNQNKIKAEINWYNLN